MKRLDLIHPSINGNKWFKLKYNIEKVLLTQHKTMLTFGGAWSNHIHATAAAGKEFGFKTIGVIRGEEPSRYSTTLLLAKECGMQLEFISREAYREKEGEDFKGWLHEQFGSFHLVPEGGSNFLGVNGCMEILSEEDKEFDFICGACATGATLAGLLLAMKPHQHAIGFSVLKNGNFLAEEVKKQLKSVLNDDEAVEEISSRFEIVTDYHFDGYGKWNDELLQFVSGFESEHHIPLDQVYTGKMMFGLMDLIPKNHFPGGSKILAIHTGGLQGKTGILKR